MSLLNVTGKSSHRELLTANMFERGPMLTSEKFSDSNRGLPPSIIDTYTKPGLVPPKGI